MKSIVQQQQLAHGISMVSRAVSTRSTLPVLANILIKSDAGRLCLSATNLELGISAWIGAKIEEEGDFTVPTRTFSDLINSLPAGQDVYLQYNQQLQNLNIKCGTLNTDIKCMSADEFPPMPSPDSENAIPLNVNIFKEMIRQVVFAASTNDTHPTFTGIHVSYDGEMLEMAATDSFRISITKSGMLGSHAPEFEALIPARTMSELARVLTNNDEVLYMSFPAGRRQVVFHQNDIELISQLIEGSFPNYAAIVPTSFKTRSVINTKQFLNACKQTEIIAREGFYRTRVDLQPGSDSGSDAVLEMSANSEQTGSSEVMVNAAIDGMPLLLSFDVRYIRAALEVINSNEVILETNAANSPCVLRPVGDDNFTHVLMPMNLTR